MFGFALGSTLCGLVLGMVAPSTLVLSITSFQILAVLFGLWIGDVLGGLDLLIWSVSGLFLHQGAYLAGVIGMGMRRERQNAGAPSLAAQVDNDLVAMDGLVGRIESGSPVSEVDTAKLRDLIRQMRRTLRDDEALEQLRRERQRAAG